MSEAIVDDIDRTAECEKCGDEYRPLTTLIKGLFGDDEVDEDEIERYCRRCRFEMIGDREDDDE